MKAPPRLAASALAHAASVMPVTVVIGARRTGKSTLIDAPSADGRLCIPVALRASLQKSEY